MKSIAGRDVSKGSAAMIVDVREYPEYAGGAIPGSKLVPLATVEKASAPWKKDLPLVLVCRSGKRATQAAESLERLGFQNLSVLEGGMESWRKAGLPLTTAANKPWSLERQVRAIAGSLVLITASLGLVVSPLFFGLTFLIGTGLLFAGVTDICLMATVLGKMPWNQAPADSPPTS